MDGDEGKLRQYARIGRARSGPNRPWIGSRVFRPRRNLPWNPRGDLDHISGGVYECRPCHPSLPPPSAPPHGPGGMVQSLAANLAMVTCKDPLRLTMLPTAPAPGGGGGEEQEFLPTSEAFDVSSGVESTKSRPNPWDLFTTFGEDTNHSPKYLLSGV